MDEDKKRIFEDTLQGYTLKRAFIEVDWSRDKKVFSNWVLVNELQVPVRPVSDSFELINNKDLLNKLNMIGRPKILNVERNPQKDTFFYQGYFSNISYVDIKGNTLFLGFEVGNTFGEKFFPFVNYSLYHYTAGLFIRTGLPIFEPFTRKTFNDVILNPKSSLEVVRFVKDGIPLNSDIVGFAINNFPQKLKHHEKIFLSATTKYEFALALSVVMKDWGRSSYELSVRINYKIWDKLWKTATESKETDFFEPTKEGELDAIHEQS